MLPRHRAKSTEHEIDWYTFLARPQLPAPPLTSLDYLRQASILVTGAGGSIGSALSARLAALQPRNLLLLDASEQALYRLQSTLANALPQAKPITILGSIADAAHLDEIFAAHHPDVVFHAAAHKHLPLLEEHPLAAITNNAVGTLTLAECIRRHDITRLVLLSTDKAVEPTSILGATKRIAELITLATGGVVVRLGNVLGTEGSVVETFLRQIATGEPLTVTDREAERYFLTCEEAIDLLITSASQATPASIFAPKLDHPHSIVSLADFLIATCSPNEPAHIAFTQPRIGDKIHEALWSPEEQATAHATKGYFEIQSQVINYQSLRNKLSLLETATRERNLAYAIALVHQLVPTYTPTSSVVTLAPTSTIRSPVPMRRRIAVVTTSRADYSHLYWPLYELAQRPDVELGVIALGAHLSPEFGNTIKEIEKDGYPIIARIECLISSDTDIGMAKTIGLATLSLADALSAWRPDLMLLIADRYEMLAPASVALALRIPIAHIEGGEVSQGAIDDAVRNALTKLAHIHFTSTDTARRRVIAMGEEPWRVHHAGAPSLDHQRRSNLLSQEVLEKRLDISLQTPTMLAAYHPVTIHRETTTEADALFAALHQVKGQLLFVYPNSDAGSRSLIDRTQEFAVTRPDTRIFVNLDAITYWSLLRYIDVLVGNSSSGIMEAASYALPTVNVGMRQQGRERAQNVIDTVSEIDSIVAAINHARSAEFRASLADMKNPYGDGYAAEKIAQVIATTPLDGLLIKAAVPVPPI